MTSALVKRLVALANESSNLDDRAVHIAKLACYWARVGEFDRAESLRTQLRETFGTGRNVQVSILIMTLEGLLHFFKSLSPDARDRFARAALLSSSFGQKDLLALTSAWLAHVDFNLYRFESMAVSLQACLDNIEYDDGTADCRVSLVLGDAFLFSGNVGASQSWYERARLAYSNLGDQASVGAIIYNRAALRASNLRLSSLVSPVDLKEVSAVDAEIRSAMNYQAMARLLSLEHLMHAAQIGMQLAAGKFQDAANSIDQLIESEVVPVGSGEHALLLADLANCRSQLSQFQQAEAAIAASAALQIDDLPPDDRALTYASLAAAADPLGKSVDALEFRRKSQESLAEHHLLTRRLASLIERFALPSNFGTAKSQPY
jgi:hypothetical protein